MPIDRFVVDIFRLIQERGVQRVVLDALGDIMIAAADMQRFHDYLYALSQHFIVNGVTALYTLESPPYTSSAYSTEEARFSSMVDSLIEIDIDVKNLPRRTLRVVKARGIAHDLRIHEMKIQPGGITLGEAVVQS